MQTKTIFRFAPALLLCGAAMLGLGPWENAAGQGQTPILFSEDPQGFNECIVNDGVFAIVGDEGDAQCTPRPPGWTPPPPPPAVAPVPGGVQIDAPAPSLARTPPVPVTVTPPPGEPLDYDDPETCRKFGGDLENSDRVCSGIDVNDTFCFVGSKDAFPCKGLFIHVGWCNHYNRAALDPFYCYKACKEGFACGIDCLQGETYSPGRIPFVTSNYRGPVFELTATVSSGKAKFERALDNPALILDPVGSPEGSQVRANVRISYDANLRAGSEYAAVARTKSSCAGLAQKHGATAFAFTVTVLPPQPVVKVVKEWLAPHVFATLTLSGLTDFEFDSAFASPIYVYSDGEVRHYGSPPHSNLQTVVTRANSPGEEFLGRLPVTVLVTFAGPPNAGRMPPSCRTPEYYTATRAANGCRSYGACALDSQLDAAAKRGDAQAACAVITLGANVNHAAPVSFGSPKPLLFGAVNRGDAAMVSVLAYNGADVNYRVVYRELVSETPLHYLAKHAVNSTLGASLEKVAQALAENGADMNAKDARGNTYLYLVAVGGHAGGMRPALRAGADPNLPIVSERTVIDQSGAVSVHYSFADFALVRAADNNHAAAVSILLDFKDESGLDLNVTEETRGLGALHVAESVEVVRLLLDAGANPNLASAPLGAGQEAGLSPLDWLARRKRYPAVAEYLHGRGGRCLKPREDLAFCEWE